MKRRIANEGVAAEGLLDIAANCLIMMSQQAQSINHPPHKNTTNNNNNNEQVFKCKTCNREFTSFQALGGHRASYKRPKLIYDDDDDGAKGKQVPRGRDDLGLGRMEKKPKMHECSICGQRFCLGQALGGHMRKHRDGAISELGLASVDVKNHQVVVDKVPVLKRSSSTRVMCLDLNLTPLENDLKLLFGTKAPKVDISF